MPPTRRRRSRPFCTSALAPIGRCFLSAGHERRSAWSPRRMTLATMVSPKASVLHATPHGDTWEKPVGLLPSCPRSLSRPRRSPASGEGGSASSPGSNFRPCPSMRCTSASGPDQSSRSRSTPGFRGWPPSPTATLSNLGPSASGSTASTRRSRRSAAAPGGRTWFCGTAATRVLRSRIAGRSVECAERDRYGRIDAVCRVDGADVNAWMVAQGWTVAYRKYSTDYVSHEAAEKAAPRGVWRGGIVEPSRWRCGERLEAAAAGGGGECRIKGKRPAERAEAPVHVADDDVSALVAGAECDADRVHFSARRAGVRMPRRRGPVASCRGRSPSA